MNSSFKAALFFLLATVVLATHEDNLKQLKKDRHPFLAPLSDLSLSMEETHAALAKQFNSLLALTPDNSGDNFWLDVLTRKRDFKFQEADKSLDEKVVESRLITIVDQLFEDIKTKDFTQAGSALESAQSDLLANTERLVKLELVSQLFKILANDADFIKTSGGKLSFRGDLIVHVINRINELYSEANLESIADSETKFTALTDALQQTKERLREEYYKPMLELLTLLKNNVFYLSKELNVLHSLAQFKLNGNEDLFISKFDFAFSTFAEVAKAAQMEENIAALFVEFRNSFTMAVKSGSKTGTFQFKKVVPRIVGTAIRVIGNTVSPLSAYKEAKEFLRLITTQNVEKPNVIAFLEEYLASGNKPSMVISNDATFAVEALKTVDIVKRIDYSKVDPDWWVTVLNHFDHILQSVSSDLINAIENTKAVACNRIDTFKTKTGYYLGLYNLLMAAVAELGAEMSDPNQWVFAFLDFARERFEVATKSSDPFDTEAVYLKKYYPQVVFYVIAFREKDESETGTFTFPNFTAGELAAHHAQLLPEIGDTFKGTLFNFFGKNLNTYLVENKLGNKFSTSQMKNLEFLAWLSGKTVPLRLFKNLQTIQNVKTEEKGNAGVKIDYQKIGGREMDSTVINIKPNKTPGKTPAKTPVIDATPKVEVTPSPQKKDPVIEEAPIKEEESPVKKEETEVFIEESPKKPVSPKKDVTEEQTEIKSPVKTDEVTPIEEEKKPIEEPIQVNPIKEDTPIKEEEKKPIEETKPVTPFKDIEEGDNHNDQQPTPKKTDDHIEFTETPKKTDDGVDPVSPTNKIIASPKVEEKEEGSVKFNGDSIQMTPTKIDLPKVVPTERLNQVEVVKGIFTDQQLIEDFKLSPDLVRMVQGMEIRIETDPNTGDETHYYYIQVAETETACHSEITELIG